MGVEKTLTQLQKFFAKLLWEKPEFYGSAEVNFCKGKVPNINVKESVKIDDHENKEGVRTK